jgi:glycosyltransferase involved in cell wall biosynthesis
MESKTPLVSITIPTRNRSDLLSESILSALNQTYKNIEVIVLDDASSDDTESIVSLFNVFDKRIRYVRNNRRYGTARNRNILLRLARGNFIGHLDDDDLLDKNAVERVMKEFKSEPKLTLVYSDYFLIDENNNILGQNIGHDFDRKNLAFMGFRHFTIYKKSDVLKLGGFNEKVFCEDGDLFMRVAKRFECKHIKELLYYYRSHKTNSGHKRPKCNVCRKQKSCNYYKIWKESCERLKKEEKDSS